MTNYNYLWISKASFSFISKQYRTLTDSQRKAWDTLAAAHREKSLAGDGTPLTGHNLFVCLNSNRALLGAARTMWLSTTSGSLPAGFSSPDSETRSTRTAALL